MFRKKSHVSQPRSRIILKMMAFVAVLSASIGYFVHFPLSLILDPYGVFWRGPTNLSIPAENFLKTSILKDFDEPEGFIFANSRGFFVDSSYATELTGIRYYNYSSGGSKMDGYLRRFRWLAATRQPKQVLFLLWYDQFFGQPQAVSLDLFKRGHPVVTGQSYFDYYLSMLDLPWSTIRREVVSIIHGEGKFRMINLKRPSRYGRFDPSTGDRLDVRRNYFEEMTATIFPTNWEENGSIPYSWYDWSFLWK